MDQINIKDIRERRTLYTSRSAYTIPFIELDASSTGCSVWPSLTSPVNNIVNNALIL